MGELPQVPDLSAIQATNCCRKCNNGSLKELMLSLDSESEWREVLDENAVYNLH